MDVELRAPVRDVRVVDDHTVDIAITVDPNETSPTELACYIAELDSRVTSAMHRSSDPEDLTSPAAVGRQLGRLRQHSVTTAHRLRRLHDGLVALGYSPRLPRSKHAEPPPYLSYLDPDQRNLGYLRSQSFVVVRRALHDDLLRLEGCVRSGAHVLVPLATDATVDHLLRLAATAWPRVDPDPD